MSKLIIYLKQYRSILDIVGYLCAWELIHTTCTDRLLRVQQNILGYGEKNGDA